MSNTEEHFVACFRKLVKTEGLPAIAEKTGLSQESLNQVLKGYKLPSGNPRGLGPKARAALSTHYPNWAALGPSTPATPADLEPNAASSADQALAVLASELRGLSREERRAVAPAIAEFALTPDSEELWDTMLATLRKARAARSARVRAEGGGNDVAASGKRAA